MNRGARIAIAVGLVVLGMLLALFFTALLGIADCNARCRSNGERAPAIALAALGVGLVVAGARLHRGARAAAAVALVVAGAATGIGSGIALAAGERGATWLALVGGAALAAGGLWLRTRVSAAA